MTLFCKNGSCRILHYLCEEYLVPVSLVKIFPLQILLFLPPEGQQGHLVLCPIYISNSMCKPSSALSLSFLSSNSLCCMNQKKKKKSTKIKGLLHEWFTVHSSVCVCVSVPPLIYKASVSVVQVYLPSK